MSPKSNLLKLVLFHPAKKKSRFHGVCESSDCSRTVQFQSARVKSLDFGWQSEQDPRQIGASDFKSRDFFFSMSRVCRVIIATQMTISYFASELKNKSSPSFDLQENHVENDLECCPHLTSHYISPSFLTITSILRHLHHLPQESEFDSNRQPDSPFDEEPLTPRTVTASQNPKYQLFLSNDPKTNGVSGKHADGPGGGGSLGENGPSRLSRWETNRLAVHRGSSESLASRDLDSAADRVGDVGVEDTPPSLFLSFSYQYYLLFVQIFYLGGDK